MSTNQPLFDSIFAEANLPKPPRLTGEELKKSGMDSVERHTPQWYVDKFRKTVEGFHAGRLFTVEDVRAIAGDPPTDDVSSNCMGPLMRMLGQKKLATKTGYHVKAKRPCMNSTELAEWKRL
jgi:hypothetical protein